MDILCSIQEVYTLSMILAILGMNVLNRYTLLMSGSTYHIHGTGIHVHVYEHGNVYK